MRTIICFDFGIKKIGLAVGNDFSHSAQELASISCDRYIPDWQSLDKHLSDWKPQLLLIGLPLNMDGTESELSKQARLFGKRLSKRYNLAIDFEDERLSSSQADSELRSTLDATQGLSKKLKSKRDQIAARLILESYFNRNG